MLSAAEIFETFSIPLPGCGDLFPDHYWDQLTDAYFVPVIAENKLVNMVEKFRTDEIYRYIAIIINYFQKSTKSNTTMCRICDRQTAEKLIKYGLMAGFDVDLFLNVEKILSTYFISDLDKDQYTLLVKNTVEKFRENQKSVKVIGMISQIIVGDLAEIVWQYAKTSKEKHVQPNNQECILSSIVYQATVKSNHKICRMHIHRVDFSSIGNRMIDYFYRHHSYCQDIEEEILEGFEKRVEFIVKLGMKLAGNGSEIYFHNKEIYLRHVLPRLTQWNDKYARTS